MEQLAPVIYRFDAFVQERDGAVAPISVEIHAPEAVGKYESISRLFCPYLENRVLTIHGVDHQQAAELAREFVLHSLGHMNARLVDAGGEPVDMPPVGPVGG